MLIDPIIFADDSEEVDEEEQVLEAEKEVEHTEVLEEDEEQTTGLPDEGEVVL